MIKSSLCGPNRSGVRLEIGDTALPVATVAGGSPGTTIWGATIVAAAGAFRERHGENAVPGADCSADTPENPDTERVSMYSFGAQLTEVRVHADTGEIRLARMLGVFWIGQPIHPKAARSQLLDGRFLS